MKIIKVWNCRSLSYMYITRSIFGKVLHTDNKKYATMFTDKAAQNYINKLGLYNHQIVRKEC